MDKNTATTTPETVSVPKEQFDEMQKTLASLSGLHELVTTQQQTIKTLEEKVATASARVDNTAAAITGAYVKPAQIAGGKYPYLLFKAHVLYRQAKADGTILEKEIDLDVDMPRPCGKLNSVMSELRNRIVPRLMKQKGITDYQVADIQYDEEKVKTETREVSFVGKKVFELTEQECEDFAIIYEGMQIPVNASLAITRQRVAQEWAYVLYDTSYDSQLIINGRVQNKMQQTVDLVEYQGVRQDYPNLESVSPSRFREIADEPEDK